MQCPDQSLVRRAVARNERACSELLDQIEGLIQAAIHQGAYVIPSADEESLCAELRVQILLSLSGWDPERGSFSTWVFGIARNVLNSYIRARSRRVFCVPLDARRHASVSAPQGAHAPQHEPVSPLVQRFWTEVLTMSPEDQIVVDSMLDEAPHRQLALRLGVSEAAAKMRAYRVRSRLRQVLSPSLP